MGILVKLAVLTSKVEIIVKDCYIIYLLNKIR